MGFFGKAYDGKAYDDLEDGFVLRGRRFGPRYASKREDALEALGKAALAVAWKERSREWLMGWAPLKVALAGARADAEAAGIPCWCMEGFPGRFPLSGEVVRAGKCSVEASLGLFLARFGRFSHRSDREFCEAAVEALSEIAAKARKAKGR